ncbi:MAG: type II toxin-antitoxin system RelE/ParE family toxin [Bryobacteraceae bacterium]|nr:type II toxin-antitoxin system RelE/ParE family toxin [Bryobacteraceae bacterium]
MTLIRWTSEAADQLKAIVSHIREGNPEIALTLAQTILARIAELKPFQASAERVRRRVHANWFRLPTCFKDPSPICFADRSTKYERVVRKLNPALLG